MLGMRNEVHSAGIRKEKAEGDRSLENEGKTFTFASGVNCRLEQQISPTVLNIG